MTTRPDGASGKHGLEETDVTNLRVTFLTVRRFVDLLRTSSATCHR